MTWKSSISQPIQTVVHIRQQLIYTMKAQQKPNQHTSWIHGTCQKSPAFHKENSRLCEILKGNTVKLRTQIQNKLAINLSERCHGQICKAFDKYGNDTYLIRNKLTFAADAIGIQISCQKVHGGDGDQEDNNLFHGDRYHQQEDSVNSQNETGCTLVKDFVLPPKVKGKIKLTKAESNAVENGVLRPQQ
ncbi:unnamed protein product [Mytilus edulis]|uniref:Uncharacterized protein n=1 Tax=Mytilus edulis TaxID=6550 RepID=A0A8S3R5V1_MYTED|nr:unnamed protein product [Mytilus edulis]